MADYKELLRRAITALPENNGSARRAVYEKARSALVGQLRSISPPLPARDITQHRLQLEDCIRQVEQEASEAVIMLGRDGSGARPSPAAARVSPSTQPPSGEQMPGVLTPVEAPVVGVMSIEEIISQASTATPPVAHDLAVAKPEQAQVPVAGPQIGPVAPNRSGPVRTETMAPVEQARGEATPRANNREAVAIEVSPQAVAHEAVDAEASPASKHAASQPVTANVPVQAALAAEREVDVEPGPSEAQDVIERAIETLDREARGESTTLSPEGTANAFAVPPKADEDVSLVPPPAARSGAGLTIFLVVFAVLLAGAGGAGFWAWREGYVDLDQMFGQAQAQVAEPAVTVPTTPTLDPVQSTETAEDIAAGPGNTTPAAAADGANTELSGLEVDERLQPSAEPETPAATQVALPEVNTDEIKTEERLPGEEAVALATDDPAASVDPAVLAGSQSLLLEATPGGETGAVPFSGTVEWSEGVDELGLPTLLGTASIPARNMSVDLTIRKNSDPTLPASHLMEADFTISDTFIGGTIATLQGVRLKDQELVPGTELVGASARVVGNSFLFALSSAPDDQESNTQLLEERRWMDLNVVYGTGRNAIITLEKDDTAQALFEKVFTAWQS